MKFHRNSQKRIYFEDAVYFVTTNTKNWIPYFKIRNPAQPIKSLNLDFLD